MKTRRVLKNWVKVVLNSLVIGVCIFAIVGLINLDRKYNEQEINKCISAGHTATYCEIHS